MNTSLFDTFATTTKADWQAQATKDLKGKDLRQTLNWQTAEGFEVESYYTIDDLNHKKVTAVQAAQRQKPGWLNQSVVKYKDEKSTNSQIVNILQKGTDSVLIDLSEIDCSQINFSKLLHNIKLSETAVAFKTNNQAQVIISELQKFINYKIKGNLADDGLATFMQTGYLSEHYFETCAEITKKTQESPQFKTICVDGQVFQNAGGNAVQELAFMLSAALTYLDKLTDLGLSADEVFSKIQFSISVGTNYFMEIAKQRALRYLWSMVMGHGSLVNGLEIKNQKSEIDNYSSSGGWDGTPQWAFITATTSPFYDAAITPYTNLLRATTEAMSAVMGGCDVLTVRPFDDVYQPSSEFSERVARNISVILSEEAHLDKTADPSAGSYYIEKLTLELAEAAWDLFVEVESLDGLIPAFEQNFIQNKIEENHHPVTSSPNHSVMVGVNKYRFDDEPFIKPVTKPVQTQNFPFKLLVNSRLSEGFEN
jgi:methylmalonyl-CoA mutase